jgi:hypothetical protein
LVNIFWASYPPPISPGDLTSLSFAHTFNYRTEIYQNFKLYLTVLSLLPCAQIYYPGIANLSEPVWSNTKASLRTYAM